MLRALLCHHRSGSTWLSGLLEEVCEHTGHRFAQVFDADMVGGDLSAFVQHEAIEVLVYMNADYAQVRGLSDLRGVHVVRDPRDVLVSSYYSHRYSHPTEYWQGLVEHRAELESLSEHEGLLAELQCRRQQFRQMQEWDYEQEGVLELCFEDLVVQPLAGLTRALDHLELLAPAPGSHSVQPSGLRARTLAALALVRGKGEGRGTIAPSGLTALLGRHSFEALSGGRARGESDPMHHYRSGVPGEWRERLQSAHLDELKRLFPELVERFSQLPR